MQSALFAVRFLTIVGVWRRDASRRQTLGKGALYYPIIGFIFGAFLGLLNWILEPHVESEILGVALVALLTLLAGGTHLQGVHEVVDRASVNRTGTGAVSAHRSLSLISVGGFIAVVFIVLFKVRSVEVSGELRNVSLLLAPALARWTLVIFLYESGEIVTSDGRIIRNVNAWHLLFTSVVTLAVTIYLVGAVGLWIGLFLSVLPLIYRGCLAWSQRSVTEDDCGALTELAETLAFVIFASV